jgi:hypothetical protein
MTGSDDLLMTHADAAWLPTGGRATVWRTSVGARLPEPTCVVRLLVTRGRQILTVPRSDGQGLDIPSRRVDGPDPRGMLRALMSDVLGAQFAAELVGYVHNVVPTPTGDYPWPVPNAYFAVWRCEVPADCEPTGRWLAGSDAPAELRERHWWPLATGRAEPERITVPRPVTPAYPTVTAAFSGAVFAVLKGEDPKTALSKAARTIDANLEANNGFNQAPASP